MLNNLTKATAAFIMEGYEGTEIKKDDFFTKDILNTFLQEKCQKL